MDELEYLFYSKLNTLFAYSIKTDFFVAYSKARDEWVAWSESFFGFCQYCNYEYEEVSREKALELTGGNLPEQKYLEFLEWFKKVDR